MRNCIFRTRTLLLTGLLSVLSARSSGGQELLEQVRDGNRAALQSIVTFHCRVSISREPSGLMPPPSGEYWRSLGTVRFRCQLGEQKFDSLVRDAKVWTIGHSPGPDGRARTTGAVTAYDGGPVGLCDPWQLGLLIFPGPRPGSMIPFDDLLKEPHEIRRVERRTEDGNEYIIVELAHARFQEEIWFEPQVNFLARKVRASSISGPPKYSGESEVVRFKEAAPAVFFPEQVRIRSYTDGKPTRTQEVTFSDIRVNQPLPPDIFQFRFPAGTQVQDLIERKQYIAAADDKPAGPVQDLPMGNPLPAGVKPRTETREEPKPWTRWILPISLGILGSGGGLWLFRKWRRGQGQ